MTVPRDAAQFKKAVRTAVADYMGSEGCTCCEGGDHKDHQAQLAKLLGIPKYPVGSGYDFDKYRTKK